MRNRSRATIPVHVAIAFTIGLSDLWLTRRDNLFRRGRYLDIVQGNADVAFFDEIARNHDVATQTERNSKTVIFLDADEVFEKTGIQRSDTEERRCHHRGRLTSAVTPEEVGFQTSKLFRTCPYWDKRGRKHSSAHP